MAEQSNDLCLIETPEGIECVYCRDVPEGEPKNLAPEGAQLGPYTRPGPKFEKQRKRDE